VVRQTRVVFPFGVVALQVGPILPFIVKTSSKPSVPIGVVVPIGVFLFGWLLNKFGPSVWWWANDFLVGRIDQQAVNWVTPLIRWTVPLFAWFVTLCVSIPIAFLIFIVVAMISIVIMGISEMRNPSPTAPSTVESEAVEPLAAPPAPVRSRKLRGKR